MPRSRKPSEPHKSFPMTDQPADSGDVSGVAHTQSSASRPQAHDRDRTCQCRRRWPPTSVCSAGGAAAAPGWTTAAQPGLRPRWPDCPRKPSQVPRRTRRRPRRPHHRTGRRRNRAGQDRSGDRPLPHRIREPDDARNHLCTAYPRAQRQNHGTESAPRRTRAAPRRHPHRAAAAQPAHLDALCDRVRHATDGDALPETVQALLQAVTERIDVTSRADITPTFRVPITDTAEPSAAAVTDGEVRTLTPSMIGEKTAASDFAHAGHDRCKLTPLVKRLFADNTVG